MRICSLLPSATELIAELGLIDSLVGVSEECRWPVEVVGRPVVSAARIDSSTMTSLEIDAAVRASVADGRSLYTVDADLIDELSPDVIVTQDLCSVCAVSSGELRSACPVGAEIVSLDPTDLMGRWRSRSGTSPRVSVSPSAAKRSPHACSTPRMKWQPWCEAGNVGACSSPSGSTRRSPRATGSPR